MFMIAGQVNLYMRLFEWAAHDSKYKAKKGKFDCKLVKSVNYYMSSATDIMIVGSEQG